MEQQAFIQHYLETHEIRKLQLGCGPNILADWLNTDYVKTHENVLVLDATQGFPFANQVFDYIFSEHQIEHISYPAGISMLRNCFRVLKPGGKIRISTPDLAKILSLYTPNKTPLQECYIQWATDTFLPNVDQYYETYVINNFFYNWGHTFLYDQEILRNALKRCGFIDIQLSVPGHSNDPHLSGIEFRLHELLVFETMVFEATRP